MSYAARVERIVKDLPAEEVANAAAHVTDGSVREHAAAAAEVDDASPPRVCR